MTPEERFEQIDATLVRVVALQELQQRNQAALIASLAEYAANADARAEQTNATIRELASAVTRYVDAADARMKRIEENLDALIRAITMEHSNGKGKGKL